MCLFPPKVELGAKTDMSEIYYYVLKRERRFTVGLNAAGEVIKDMYKENFENVLCSKNFLTIFSPA